jgi:uncharacterized protein
LLGGADPNTAHNGVTVLMTASTHGHAGIVRDLLDYGADPDRQLNGWTALSLAVYHDGDVEVVRMLVGAGADPCLELPQKPSWGEAAGKAAKDVASRRGKADMASYLAALCT